jgi:hypothetical protein
MHSVLGQSCKFQALRNATWGGSLTNLAVYHEHRSQAFAGTSGARLQAAALRAEVAKSQREKL